MKLIKITSLALVAGFMIGATGCTKKIDEFGDMNLNPGQVAEPNTAALLTNSLAAMGGEVWSVVPGLYAQLYAETQYTDASRYSKQQPDFGGYYSGVLYDMVNIIKYNSNSETAGKAAGNGSNANQIATARILKAWWFLRVTDAWGDVPYFQALNFEGIIPYDKQQDIYTDIFKELKEAVAQFDGGDPFKGDILFNGDVAAWKRFANSTRMMMALRIVKADANKGKAEFLDALNSPDGYIATNAQNALIVYPGGNFNNPFYAYYNITQRLDYAISNTVTNFMNANGDRRINVWGSSNVGFTYGLERNDAIAFASANPNWARIIHPSMRTPTMPMPVLTASQITLARAEAAQRGWTTENAATLYTLGVRQNWEYWGVYDAAAFAAYMADPDIALTPGTEIQKIATQRWLAAFPDGQEAWNIWRSTGFPVLAVAPNNNNLQIPRRFAIATTHYGTNPNTNAVATLYTVAGEPDSQYGRPWWDQ